MRRHWMLLVLSACTLTNDVDVCGTSGSEGQVNQNATGIQQIEGSAQLSATPDGNALISFVSAGAVFDPFFRTDIIGTLIDRRANALRTCESEREIYASNNDASSALLRSAVRVPRARGDFGAIVFTMNVDDPPSQSLWVQPIDHRGCSAADSTLVATYPDGTLLDLPLLLETPSEAYTVLWSYGDVATAGIGARAIRPGPAGIAFLPVVDPTTGEVRRDGSAVDLLRAPGLLRYDAATGDDRFLVAWYALDGFEGRIVQYAVFDETLELVRAPSALEVFGDDGDDDLRGLAVAWTGEHWVVAWLGADEDRVRRLRAQRIARTGEAQGRIATLSDGVADQEGPSVALAHGPTGLLAVWEEVGGTGRDDDMGTRLVGRLLDPATLEPRFTNLGCDDGVFPVTEGRRGNQSDVGATTLTDGTFLVAWSDDGGNGLDDSESAVRAATFVPEDLVPGGIE